MNRRSVLQALPAALAVGAVPALAVPAEESPIAAMHREIERLRAIANRNDIPETEADAACDRMMELADDIVDLPARDMGEMMLKFMGHTVNGDHETGCCPRSDDLWAEARALIGGEA